VEAVVAFYRPPPYRHPLAGAGVRVAATVAVTMAFRKFPIDNVIGLPDASQPDNVYISIANQETPTCFHS
jgi:hypothetical protein